MNRWTIIKQNGKNKYNQSLVLCKCQCGTERTVLESSIRQNKSRSCGCLQKELAALTMKKLCEYQVGKNNPQWKGGKTTHKKRGYVHILSPNHPRVKNRKNQYVQEHILVMEKLIGRFLLPNETVHHKNGIRNDNRPDNLELWSKSQPYGQRVSDLLAYAKEIVKLYEGLTIVNSNVN